MGTVYHLRHRASGQDLIVRKYASPVLAYDFLKGLRHDHLPQVYDALTFCDGQLVLEEFIDGITVAEVLETGTYTYLGAKRVLWSVGLALVTLHEAGIVHRDVKPENVMIRSDGQVKLIDLNASRHTSPQKKTDTVVLGTIGYASPEQFGICQCDQTADIYALGVLLNVMLTGNHPSQTMAKGKAGRIIRKCTHIDPTSRFPTVKKFLQAL